MYFRMNYLKGCFAWRHLYKRCAYYEDSFYYSLKEILALGILGPNTVPLFSRLLILYMCMLLAYHFLSLRKQQQPSLANFGQIWYVIFFSLLLTILQNITLGTGSWYMYISQYELPKDIWNSENVDTYFYPFYSCMH